MVDLANTRIITISGRIGAGSTSLAKHLGEALGWKHIEGGEVFWEAVRTKMHVSTKDTDLRPDEEDLLFEEKQKQILQNKKHIILESKLAGFCAQGLKDVFKIVVTCENEQGEDQAQIRIDRLINREKMAYNDAKTEVLEREQNDLSKWRKLYAKGDKNWVYWDKKYYDFVINTFKHGQDESLRFVLEKIGHNK